MLQAVGERVIVDVPDYETVTKAGIYVLEDSHTKTRRGTVQSVGEGYVDIHGVHQAIHLDVGDVVIYMVPGPVPLRDQDGKSYMALRPLDILAVERPEAKKPTRKASKK